MIKIIAYCFNAKGQELSRLEQSFEKMIDALTKLNTVKHEFPNWEIYKGTERVMSNFRR